MKIELHFDSAKEFSLFICSAAALDFKTIPQMGVDLSRCLSTETYWPFLDHVSSVHVLNVTYMVQANSARFESEDCKVINYMINDVQMKNDTIEIRGVENLHGSERVREYIETLPRSFGLRAGWRTEYLNYIFQKK